MARLLSLADRSVKVEITVSDADPESTYSRTTRSTQTQEFVGTVDPTVVSAWIERAIAALLEMAQIVYPLPLPEANPPEVLRR